MGELSDFAGPATLCRWDWLTRCRVQRAYLPLFGFCCLPGLAPAGDHLFFASPKKRWEKKGEPDSSALRARCVARAKREAQKLALRAQTSALLFPLAPALLASSLRPKSEPPIPEQPGSAQDAPPRALGLRNWILVFGFRSWKFGIQSRYEETSSAGLDGSGLALSERSEFSQTPARPSNAVWVIGVRHQFRCGACAAPCGRAEGSANLGSDPKNPDESGSPSLCLLSLGEARESESPAGARPGRQREQNQSVKSHSASAVACPGGQGRSRA